MEVRGTLPTMTRNTGMKPWPPGFAYDFDVVFPPPRPPLERHSPLPRRRGRRLTAAKRRPHHLWGRIRCAPTRSDGHTDRSSPGRADALPVGLHGWNRVRHERVMMGPSGGCGGGARWWWLEALARRRWSSVATSRRRQRSQEAAAEPRGGCGGEQGRLGFKP
jgi:hypothetical protein